VARGSRRAQRSPSRSKPSTLRTSFQRPHRLALLYKGLSRLFQGPFCLFETLSKAGDAKLRGKAYVKIGFAEELRAEYYPRSQSIVSVLFIKVSAFWKEGEKLPPIPDLQGGGRGFAA